MNISRRAIFVLFMAAFGLLLGTATHGAADKPDGLELFKANCAMCHGADGKGFEALKTPNFTSPKWQDSVKDSQILDAIKNGKKDTAMVGFADKLSIKEMLAVLQQIRAFRGK